MPERPDGLGPDPEEPADAGEAEERDEPASFTPESARTGGHGADEGSHTGRLLVAAPGTGGVFTRSVVLLLHHDDDGAHGVILNKPLDAPVDAVLAPWHDHVSEPSVLFQGGPVGMDSAMGVIGMPGSTGESDGQDPVGISLLFGSVGVVDLDAPPDLVVPGALGLRIFAGYSGWAAGQLEDEIEEGAWFVLDAEAGDPFLPDTTRLWHQVLGRQHGRLSFLATWTEHPERN